MQQIFLAFSTSVSQLCGFLLDKGGLSITARLNVFSKLVGLKVGIHGATSCRLVACNSNEYG